MILAPIIAAIASASSIPVLIRVARRLGCEDQPDGELKPHRVPTPVLGGIGIAVGTALGAALVVPFDDSYLGLILVILALSGIGLIDDLRGLPPGIRLAFQSVAALALVLLEHGMVFGGTSLAIWGSGALTLFLFVAVVNTTNMLDGIDGLCGGCSVISALGFAAAFHSVGDGGAATISLALAGGGVGFLLFNFPPAKIFMGDHGSYFLGSVLALLCFRLAHDAGGFGLAAGLLIVAVPLLDTSYAVTRRISDRVSLFAGDRRHAYDRMMQRGMTVRATALALYAVAAGFASLGALLVILRG
jgi:UDP-GlcNAc:undecaprenyl-phosphate/decaprenyl-phosphate GlcNAc-1-phosphate transferase